MKKILFAIMLAMPLIAMAAKRDDSKYLRGAVPEQNGIVTFTQTITAPGKSQTELHTAMQGFIRELIGAARQDLRTRIVSDEGSTIVANVEEIMTFKKKFLNWDHCYFRYLINAEATNEETIKLTITKISYYYNFDQEGNLGENYKAEEWISDSAALNKAGTKLFPRSGKFRRKTVDRVEEIFNAAKAAVEQKQ